MEFDEIKVGIYLFIGLLSLMLMLMSCTNSCSVEEWNNGVCIDCNVNYELRAVSNGLHYYVCPECHNEISRY